MRLESVVVIPEMQPGYGVYGIRLLGHKLPKPQNQARPSLTLDIVLAASRFYYAVTHWL